MVGAGLAGAQQAAVFEDRTADLGLTPANSAACWVDIDNDGWTDLCTGGVVWRNEAGQSFSKLTEGLGTVIAADCDNDGFVDLFSWSAVKMYRNDAGLRFTEVPLGDLPKCVSRGACWGDLNGDGFVDLYVGGYEDWDAGITYPDMLLMNQGGKSFTLAWAESRYRARGVTACDFDEDGDLDIYVSNYRLQPNILWLNDGAGALTNASGAYNTIATSKGFDGGHSIGSCWGDLDNDGRMDLFAGNFAHRDSRGDQPQSRILRNTGADNAWVFEDLGTCGVFYQESYASPALGDCDNDGDLDVFFTTVYGTASFGVKNYPALFLNDGTCALSDATADCGLAGLPSTYQAAWADFDNDGDLDVISAGKLFVNQSTGNHWLEVRLEGDGTTVNRSAIGAQVRISVGDDVLTRQVEAGTGEGNQNSLVLHFGLGAYEGPVDLEILWPGGMVQAVGGVDGDQRIIVEYDLHARATPGRLRTQQPGPESPGHRGNVQALSARGCG